MTVRPNSSTKRASFSPDYFENLYANDDDPWRFASSDYERSKYAATLEALKDHRFGRQKPKYPGLLLSSLGMASATGATSGRGHYRRLALEYYSSSGSETAGDCQSPVSIFRPD